MVINGRPRQSCTALVDKFTHPIRLEPMKTFPVVRDLIVDREFMFDSLKKSRHGFRLMVRMILEKAHVCLSENANGHMNFQNV